MAISHLTRAFFASAASLALLIGCDNSSAPKASETAETPAEIVKPVVTATQDAPAGQLPEGVTPTAYRVHLITRPAEANFTGHVEIDTQLDALHSRIWLHALEQTVTRAVARLPDGQEITATFTNDQAPGGVSRLDFETPLPAGPVTLIMDYEAPFNLGLAGLYKATQAGTPYLATQMEPIDARRMMPSFDEPRFKTPWTISVDAPEGLRVVANGADLTQTPLEDSNLVRHTFATTRPIQSYLVALAVGPYDMREAPNIPATDLRAEPIPLRGFAATGKGDKLQEALDETSDILLWQESYFDYPYPYGKLDLIAAPEFAYGAMENAGAIIYREAALLIDDRTSLDRKRRIMTTHAHELGHQWFGNLVTPKWWNDIWLNEAFATWISYKSMNAVDPEGGWKLAPIAAGLSAMPADSLKSARQIRNPITRNGDIMDGFDSITYRKGGSVLNMFESYLGEEAFREGMRLHMKRFEDGVADADDFMQSLADGSGQSEVVPAFKSFILQPGIPLLDVTLSCPSPALGKLVVVQSRYAPAGSEIDTDASTWKVPFAATVTGPAGIRTVRKMLDAKTTEIDIEGDCPDWVMPNAGGAGYWRFTLDDTASAKLADKFSALTEGEQLVYIDSLKASFTAGSVDASTLLDTLAATATGAPDAVRNGLEILPKLNSLLTPADQEKLSVWIQKSFGPTESFLMGKPAEQLSASQTLLLADLRNMLLRYGNDDLARADLLSDAQAFIGQTGPANAKALSPSDLSIAMTIGTRLGGEDFIAAATDFVLASDNQNERAQILSSIVRIADESTASTLLTRALGDEFSGNELYVMWSNALRNDANLSTLWPQFESEFDAIIAKYPEIRKPQISAYTGRFCSVEQSNTAAAFFQSKAEQIEGYERSLAQGLERARLCAALKDTQSNALAKALNDKETNE